MLARSLRAATLLRHGTPSASAALCTRATPAVFRAPALLAGLPAPAPCAPLTLSWSGLRALTTSVVPAGRIKRAGGAPGKKNDEAQPDAVATPPDEQPAPSPYEDPHDPTGRVVPQERTSDLVLRDKATRMHMVKVYGTTGSGLGLATAASAVSIATGLVTAVPFGGMVFGLGSMIPLMMFMRTTPETAPATRTALLGTFFGMSGLASAPLLYTMAFVNPVAIPVALGGTALIFAGATGAAMLLPRSSMLPMGSALGGGAMILFVGGIGLAFFPNPAFFNVFLFGGLALFTAFLGYDTQKMIERFQLGDRDYLKHSVDFFIDLLQIFRFLLIMIGLDRD